MGGGGLGPGGYEGCIPTYIPSGIIILPYPAMAISLLSGVGEGGAGGQLPPHSWT